jgi:hypothetical protein
MQAHTMSGDIVVADGFLPAYLFDRTLTEFQQQQRRQQQQQQQQRAAHHDDTAAAQEQHGHRQTLAHESVVQLALPLELKRGLREFATGDAASDDIWKVLPNDNGPIELIGQVQRGNHPDHADVTCCGRPVNARVCLLYLSGHGALVFTDVATGQELRVKITPNRAVSWPNARHTHRVEAAPGYADEPRLMIGPYFSDNSSGGEGQLARCMSPKGMVPNFSGTDLALIGAVLVVGTPIAAAGAVVGGAVGATLAVPTAVVYYTHKAVVSEIAEIAGTAKLGSQVRKGEADAGYRFGDLTRGILAKGAGKRRGDTAADYAFGDFVSGLFTKAEDPAVQLANQVSMVKAGKQLMMQHRLAVAKLMHPRLSSESFVADLDIEVLNQVIAHLGFQMLHDASDDAKVETLLRTNSRLAVYGTLVSDDRYAQPGGPSIGDPFAVLDDAGQIFMVGLLDSYDNENHLYCIVAQGGGTLIGFPPDRVRPMKALIGSYVQIGPVGDEVNVMSTLFKPGSIWDTYTALNPTLCVVSMCNRAPEC